MERALKKVDGALSGVLVLLVLAMVLSISCEVILNAAVQPAASALLRAKEREAPNADAPATLGTRFLRGVSGGASRLSAPLNTASQILLVWVGILGSALALRRRAHMGVDALVRLYPPRLQILLDRVSTALVAAFSLAVLVVGGYAVCARAFSSGSRMPGLDALNHGWFYLVLGITGALNLLYCAGQLVRPARPEGAPRPDPPGDALPPRGEGGPP